jgi:mitogen-activated protein kinase 1/3
VKTRAVCSATDRRTQRNVAIKKITDAFAHATDTKRTLREAQLLRLISHENVIAIVDILPPVKRGRVRRRIRDFRAHGRNS